MYSSIAYRALIIRRLLNQPNDRPLPFCAFNDIPNAKSHLRHLQKIGVLLIQNGTPRKDINETLTYRAKYLTQWDTTPQIIADIERIYTDLIVQLIKEPYGVAIYPIHRRAAKRYLAFAAKRALNKK